MKNIIFKSFNFLIATFSFVSLFTNLPKYDADGKEIRSGSLKNINAWMKEHVWKKADRQTPKEWILEITGRELTPDDFLDYIEEKFRGIYGI